MRTSALRTEAKANRQPTPVAIQHSAFDVRISTRARPLCAFWLLHHVNSTRRTPTRCLSPFTRSILALSKPHPQWKKETIQRLGWMPTIISQLPCFWSGRRWELTGIICILGIENLYRLNYLRGNMGLINLLIFFIEIFLLKIIWLYFYF